MESKNSPSLPAGYLQPGIPIPMCKGRPKGMGSQPMRASSVQGKGQKWLGVLVSLGVRGFAPPPPFTRPVTALLGPEQCLWTLGLDLKSDPGAAPHPEPILRLGVLDLKSSLAIAPFEPNFKGLEEFVMAAAQKKNSLCKTQEDGLRGPSLPGITIQQCPPYLPLSEKSFSLRCVPGSGKSKWPTETPTALMWEETT